MRLSPFCLCNITATLGSHGFVTPLNFIMESVESRGFGGSEAQYKIKTYVIAKVVIFKIILLIVYSAKMPKKLLFFKKIYITVY